MDEWPAFVAAHLRYVGGAVLRSPGAGMLCWDDVEDVRSNAVVRALTANCVPDDETGRLRLLGMCARRELQEWFRDRYGRGGRKPRQAFDVEPDSPVDPWPAVDALLAIREAFPALPAYQRRALGAAAEGWAGRGAGARCGLADSSVTSIQSRARGRLRAELAA